MLVDPGARHGQDEQPGAAAEPIAAVTQTPRRGGQPADEILGAHSAAVVGC